MTEDLQEAAGRLEVAETAYAGWTTEALWDEFGTCADEAWAKAVDDQPDPIELAMQEAIGLALIGRGATQADLSRGYPQETK